MNARYAPGRRARPARMRDLFPHPSGSLALPCLALLALCAGPAEAREPADTLPPAPATAAERQRWALVPILMSTAETGVQAGALVMRFLAPADTADKPSSIGFAARLSQLGQAQLNLFPEWYSRGNRYHVDGEVNYIRWPADFYGIGNDRDLHEDSADAYLAQGLNGTVIVEREWFRNVSAGPMARFSYEDIEIRGNRGLLTPDVPGGEGGWVAGLGLQATYDGRDGVYWARNGSLVRAKTVWHRPAWGSGFAYECHTLEARRFFPVAATGALGLAASLQVQEGDVPFRELSTADGDHALRGIVRGKYRDRDLLLLQAEYKSYLPDAAWLSHRWIRNRLGWVVFAEAGQVAPETDAFAWDGFRPAYGLGLRYAMNPEQRMNIRLDIGIVDGGIAPAINIKEAF